MLDDGLILAAAGLLLVFVRYHAFGLPLETDECNYAYIAARLLDGDRLYVDVWDHQPFGVFIFFAGLISVFGDAPVVFRCAATAFSLVTLAMIFAVVRRCSGLCAAATAAVTFAIVSSDPGTAGEGCNREIFMTTFVIAAWWAILRSASPSTTSAFVAGALLGVGSTFKTILAAYWVALAIFIVWQGCLRGDQGRWRRVVRLVAALSAGPAMLWVGSALYFWGTNRIEVFVDAVFGFNLSYSDGGGGVIDRVRQFFAPRRHPFVFESAAALWVLTIGATGWHCFSAVRQRNAWSMAIVLLVGASVAAVCLPGRFWPHYYYLMVAPCVLAVATALGSLANGASWLVFRYSSKHGGHESRYAGIASASDHHTGGQAASGIGAAGGTRFACLFGVFIVGALCAILPVSVFASEYRCYLSQPPFGITVKRYNSRDFWGRAQGENVRRVTDADDTVFVYGNEAEIYYYSGRRSASRYTMITGLQAGYAGHQARRELLLQELRAQRPRVILILFDEPPFDAWRGFLEEHYGEVVGWDRHDATGKIIMLVYALRDRPIAEIDWDWDREQVGGWLLGGRPAAVSGKRP